MKKSRKLRSFTNTSIREKLYLVIVLSVIAAVYFSTLPVNHNEAPDSLHYLYTISYGSLSDQFHPDHLLYNFINYGFFHLLKLFGYGGNAEFITKFINIFAALLVLWLIYIITTKLNFPVLLKYVCIFLLAFSFSFWWYSVECETYIIPIIFILLCIHRLVLIRQDFFRLANHLFLGAFCALAILFHKQHILLVVVILLSYILIFYENRMKIAWKKLLQMMIIYCLICSFAVIFSYLAVAVFVRGLFDLKNIINWAANLNALSVGLSWHVSDLLIAIIGFCRVFIGGHYVLTLSIFSDRLTKMMPTHLLRGEIFLVEDFSIFKSISLYILTFVALLLITYIIFQIAKHRSLSLIRSSKSDLSQLRFFVFIVLTGYFMIYSLFNIFYEPQLTEMWISLGPIVFLALGLLVAPVIHKIKIKVSIGLVLICLFFINLFGSVLPQADLEHDYWYKFNSWLIENCKAGDLVVSGAGYISDGYVVYYSGAKVFSTLGSDQTLEKKFHEIVASYKPEKIYFSSTVYQPIEEIVNRFRFDNSYAKLFFSNSTKYLTLIHSGSYQKIYLYKKDDQ